MILGSHVIFSAYGFWLPNDPRGSWSTFVGSWELFRYGPATKTDERHSVADRTRDRAARLAAKNALDWHCSTPLQVTVAAFIADGHLTRHVRKMRDVYGRRRELLRRAFDGPLGKWLEPIPSFYGMHTTAIARQGVDVESAAARVFSDGIKIHTLERYFVGEPTHTGLVFGYGAAEPTLGIEKLCRALSST